MERFLISVSFCVGLLPSLLAQDVPPEITNPEEREILGIAVTLTRPSLAYQSAAIEKLLAEANFFSDRLRLPTRHPMRASDANIRVIGPWFSKSDSTNTNLSKADRIRAAAFFATGVVESDNYAFAFGGPDNHRYIHRFRVKTEVSILDLYPELAATPSLIDTNGAYQLATQWLSSVSVDISALEKLNNPSFFQHFFWGKAKDLPKDQWTYNPPTTTNKTMLPIFDVSWGGGVKVTILGSTKELLELEIRDASFLKRPPLIITNALELNARPDPPVKHLERPTQEPQTNSAGPTNPPISRPPPFRQKVRDQGSNGTLSSNSSVVTLE